MATSAANPNQPIIEEFRANEGRVGGYFDGAPLLLLHHVGAKSGVERVNPLMYLTVDDGYAVFASNGGQDTNPAWYHNLLAHPRATVEMGKTTFEVAARVADDEARDPIWDRQKREHPGFAAYETSTSRQIPVVILEPASSAR